MKKYFIPQLALLIALGILSCNRSEEVQWQRIVDGVVDNYELTDGPGGVVALARGNQIIYSRAFGYADVSRKLPNTTNTLFDIASCSKQFTAASVLFLEEQGKIDLDQAIQHYFPEFVIKEPIPVRSLLTHASGLHDYSEMLILARGRDDVPSYSKKDILETIYQQPNLSFTPLADENYSNTNFVILAELVERVSQMPFETFVTQTFLDPLGIPSSEIQFLGASKNDSIQLAIGYPHRLNESAEFIAEDHSKQHDSVNGSTDQYIFGASGMKANIHGLVKWMGNYQTGKIGDSPLMKSLLKKDTLTNGRPTTFARGLESGVVPEGYTWVEHTGRNNFTSVMLWWPDFDISMIALMNTQDIWAQSLTNEFCMQVLATVPPPEELLKKREEPTQNESPTKEFAEVVKKATINLSHHELEQFVGSYPAEAPVGARKPPSGGVGVNKIRMEDGHLVGIRYDGARFNLNPVGPSVLAIENAPIEFDFVDLDTNKPGFRFINLQDGNNSQEVAYRITESDMADLKQFCGSYSCPTLENAIPIEIDLINGKLQMQWGILKKQTELHYLDDDRLTTYKATPNAGMQCNLVLKRNGEGEVVGFNYEGHRIWNLYFEKQQPVTNNN